MASPLDILEAPIPRPLLWIGAPIAAFVLIVTFVFLRFPYDDLAQPMIQQLGEATGSDVTVGHIEPRITIGGPGVAAQDVHMVQADSTRMIVDEVRVRPAWSTSWLRGDPALKVELESPLGDMDATLVLGDSTAWTGELVDMDIAYMPVPKPRGLLITGRLTAAADLIFLPTGPAGPFSFDANAGTIGHPLLPIPLDYDRINGDLTLGGDALVTLRSFEMDGPVVFAQVSGRILPGARPGEEQLDLALDVELKSPPLRALVQQMGVPLDARGRASFELGGTTSAPQPRYR